MRSSWLVALTACVLFVACGDDSDSVNARPPSPDAPGQLGDAAAVDTLPVAGKLTIVAENLTALVGKVLLIGAVQGVTRAAGACVSITTTPQTITTVLKTLNMPTGNPCDLGAEIDLAPGTYQISAGIYTRQMTPEQCATITVDMEGDTSVTLLSLGAQLMCR